MDRGYAGWAADTCCDATTLESTTLARVEGIGRLDVANENIRRIARDLIASRGDDALVLADYNAAVYERAGLWEHARFWRKIEGTLLGMCM